MPARIDYDIIPNEMELLGQDVIRCYVNHNKIHCHVAITETETETLILNMQDILKILNEVHIFAKKARKHFHIEKVSGFDSEI